MKPTLFKVATTALVVAPSTPVEPPSSSYLALIKNVASSSGLMNAVMMPTKLWSTAATASSTTIFLNAPSALSLEISVPAPGATKLASILLTALKPRLTSNDRVISRAGIHVLQLWIAKLGDEQRSQGLDG